MLTYAKTTQGGQKDIRWNGQRVIPAPGCIAFVSPRKQPKHQCHCAQSEKEACSDIHLSVIAFLDIARWKGGFGSVCCTRCCLRHREGPQVLIGLEEALQGKTSLKTMCKVANTHVLTLSANRGHGLYVPGVQQDKGQHWPLSWMRLLTSADEVQVPGRINTPGIDGKCMLTVQNQVEERLVQRPACVMACAELALGQRFEIRAPWVASS